MQISSDFVYWICMLAITLVMVSPFIILKKKILFRNNSHELIRTHSNSLWMLLPSLIFTGVIIIWIFGYWGLITLGFSFNRVEIKSDKLILYSPLSKYTMKIHDIKYANIIKIGSNSPYISLVLKNNIKYKSIGTSKIKILEKICEMIDKEKKTEPYKL